MIYDEFFLFKCEGVYFSIPTILKNQIYLFGWTIGKQIIQTEPCVPSPCGPNSQCRVIGETAVCSCVQNYIGRPPNCRPECTLNAECPGNLACINEKCTDPCPGSCGSFTTCTVSNHQPNCRCYAQYSGDPFVSCSPIPSKIKLCNPLKNKKNHQQ